jgi:adenylylsulfate kinase
MIYWLIGQPGSGKSTLARMIRDNFMHPCILLDGDDLRVIFANSYEPKHFTKEYRIEQTRILQKLITYIESQNSVDVIVSTVNPYRDIREEFKATNENVVEIYVWKTVDRGREKFAVAEYEVPLENFISVNTTNKTPEESLDELWDSL